MNKKIGYDLNSLIGIGNIAVCGLSICLYCAVGGNQYVDFGTLILLCLTGAGNIMMLLYEEKKRDPFVLLLLAVNLFFYTGRVATLLYVPWSIPLQMFSFTSVDLNYSLIFIMLSNIAIFLGLSTAGSRIFDKEKYIVNGQPANFYTVLLILLSAIIIFFFLPMVGGISHKFADYMSLCINPYWILIFTAVYFVINFDKFSDTKRVVLLSVILIDILMTTLCGSRSAILTLAYTFLVAVLSVKGRAVFNRKMLLMGVIIIPVSLILFLVATGIRGNIRDRAIVGSEHLNFLKKTDLFASKDIRELCRPLFDRMGFLDYSTVLIRNQEIYRKIFNFKYYFKSIVDNDLTPGFGALGIPKIFGAPKVSHCMSYVARGEALPTAQQITNAYQSDMPTLYGEYYVLFGGYPALIILFIFSFIFKKVYLAIQNKDAFSFYLYRALVLYIFYIWINSFGTDWILRDIIVMIWNVLLFRNFYKARKSKCLIPSHA